MGMTNTPTSQSTTHVRVVSAMATRFAWAEQDWTRETEWNGELDIPLHGAFRYFNRVDQADVDRLEAIGYRLPSMSVGDLLTIGTETFQVHPVGFEKVDPPAPCGSCRRCAIHDDPGGCLEVERWEREALDSVR